MSKMKSLKQWWIPIIALVVALSCSMPGETASQPTQDNRIQETQFALAVQETSLAMQQTSMAIANQQQTLQAGTAVANQMIAETNAALAAAPTQAPPTAEPLPPTQEVAAPPAEALPPPAPADTSQDMAAKIKGANVLLYENMAGNFDRYRLVQRAVNNMNFSGGKVMDVADRDGDFKNELIGTTKWDLIIAAGENRDSIQGEFWEYVHDRVKKKTAVIIEIWYMDQHYSDIAPMFGDCGIAYERDWPREWDYNMLDYAIYWLQPDHEYFSVVPHKDISLGNPNYLYWIPPRTNDAGDRIRIASGGDAVLLAGTHSYDKSRSGVMATCMEGRLVVQTYSTHDYKESEVVHIWEDNMVWTLTNHFKAME